MIEIIIGTLATAYTIYVLGSLEGPPEQILLGQALALSGGIYITVRGIDNFVTGLSGRSPSAATQDEMMTLRGNMTALEVSCRNCESKSVDLETKMSDLSTELQHIKDEISRISPP